MAVPMAPICAGSFKSSFSRDRVLGLTPSLTEERRFVVSRLGWLVVRPRCVDCRLAANARNRIQVLGRLVPIRRSSRIRVLEISMDLRL